MSTQTLAAKGRVYKSRAVFSDALDDDSLVLEICIEVGEEEPPLSLTKEEIEQLWENPIEGIEALRDEEATEERRRRARDEEATEKSRRRAHDEERRRRVSDDDECEKSSYEISTRALGRRGENAAVDYLEMHGMEILDRNWECMFGEADIIALDTDGTLCFIEVKTRRSIEAGLPEEHVTADKRDRYERIAMCYLADKGFDDCMMIRFDCIGICVVDGHRALLRHHRGWATAGDYGIE